MPTDSICIGSSRTRLVSMRRKEHAPDSLLEMTQLGKKKKQ